MEKTTENQQTQSRALTESTTQRKGFGDSSSEFIDNRSESAAQLRIAEVMRHSPQAKEVS